MGLGLQIVKNGECMKNGKKIILSVVLIVSLALVIAAAFWLSDAMYAPSGDGNEDSDGALGAIYIDGELCYPKSGVRNYLIMGIDSEGEAATEALGQADFIMVLSFDENTKTYTMVSVSRDTMTIVDEYDDFGGHRVVYKQVALSHSNAGGGDGVTDIAKCKNTAKAVSGILLGMEFDGYMSMTMDAVSLLLDQVGGVEVTVEEDLTSVDPSLVKGNTVKLEGELALKYVRARGGLEDSSNTARMKRQEAFLQAFFAKVSDREWTESELIKIYDEVHPYVCNDAGEAGYEVLFNMLNEYTVGEKISLKGETTVGKGGYVEFYVDEEHVKEVMLSVFYEKTKK